MHPNYRAVSVPPFSGSRLAEEISSSLGPKNNFKRPISWPVLAEKAVLGDQSHRLSILMTWVGDNGIRRSTAMSAGLQNTPGDDLMI